MWHDCTVLREHRGDGYLVAVASAGLVSPKPHLLNGEQVDARQQQYRGWDDDAWQRAADRVRSYEGLGIEPLTDRLAAPAYDALDEFERHALAELLEPLARDASDQLPYPNAMGLPPLWGGARCCGATSRVAEIELLARARTRGPKSSAALSAGWGKSVQRLQSSARRTGLMSCPNSDAELPMAAVATRRMNRYAA